MRERFESNIENTRSVVDKSLLILTRLLETIVGLFSVGLEVGGKVGWTVGGLVPWP